MKRRMRKAGRMALFAVMLWTAAGTGAGCDDWIYDMVNFLTPPPLDCDLSGKWTLNNSWGLSGAELELRTDHSVTVNGRAEGRWAVEEGSSIYQPDEFDWYTAPLDGVRTWYFAFIRDCDYLAGQMFFNEERGTWNATRQ